MPSRPLQILLIEDDPDHALLIQRHLGKVQDRPVQLERADRLANGLSRLSQGHVDAVLLDLALPDSPITDTLAALIAHAPTVPVIVLTSLDDLETATQAVQQGAQDYLVKAQITGDVLVRAIRYAIERKRYEVKLEHSNRELEQFAHLVAHEVKTPLSIVSYCCQLLETQRDKLDGEIWDFVTATRNAVTGMAELVNDLLEYASVGARELTMVPVSAEAVLEQALAGLQVQIRESGATVTHGPLPTLTVDAVQLKQLLVNLIGNAIKYRRPGVPPEVHVTAERQRGDWRFRIRDNGIGLESEHAERIFGVFERLHSSEEYPGSGVGLAICKRIVERHGGRIGVESHLGHGSTFHFTLPAHTAG